MSEKAKQHPALVETPKPERSALETAREAERDRKAILRIIRAARRHTSPIAHPARKPK